MSTLLLYEHDGNATVDVTGIDQPSASLVSIKPLATQYDSDRPKEWRKLLIVVVKVTGKNYWVGRLTPREYMGTRFQVFIVHKIEKHAGYKDSWLLYGHEASTFPIREKADDKRPYSEVAKIVENFTKEKS